MVHRAPDSENVLLLNDKGDYLTLTDLRTNLLGTGVTGGGKTTGPGLHWLRAVMRAGGGGIVNCAKPAEKDEILRLAAEEGRLGSVIVWNGRNHGFNFLAYTLAKLGADGVNGVTEYLMRIIELVRGASAMPAGNGEAFWLDALRMLFRFSLPILYHARGTIRISDLMRFMRSAPTSPQEWQDKNWQERSFFYGCLRAAEPNIDDDTGARVVGYWRDEFSRMDAKLRGNIMAGFAMLDRFNHGWLKDAVCGETTIVPELCFSGAIIIIDTPRATMGEDGVILEMIFKDAWQTAVLSRNALPAALRQRFVFCYADECQEILSPRDADFLAMSRSSNAGTIYLTQSIPSITAKLSGQNARERAYQLIGNFGIRVFCANSCAETNEFAARTIGKALQNRGGYTQNQSSSREFGMNTGEGTNWGTNSGYSYTSGRSGGQGSSSSTFSVGSSSGGSDSWGRTRGGGSSEGESWSQNEQMDYVIEPGAFGQILKTGGPANGNRVSAIVYQASRVFKASGTNTLLVEFQQ